MAVETLVAKPGVKLWPARSSPSWMRSTVPGVWLPPRPGMASSTGTARLTSRWSAKRPA